MFALLPTVSGSNSSLFKGTSSQAFLFIEPSDVLYALIAVLPPASENPSQKFSQDLKRSMSLGHVSALGRLWSRRNKWSNEDDTFQGLKKKDLLGLLGIEQDSLDTSSIRENDTQETSKENEDFLNQQAALFEGLLESLLSLYNKLDLKPLAEQVYVFCNQMFIDDSASSQNSWEYKDFNVDWNKKGGTFIEGLGKARKALEEQVGNLSKLVYENVFACRLRN